MRRFCCILVATAVVATAWPARAADTAPADPAGPAAKVLITVGSGEVTDRDLAAVLSEVEAFKRSAFVGAALTKLTESQVKREFAAANKLPIDEERFDAYVTQMRAQLEQNIKNLRTEMAISKYMTDRISDKHVAEYIKAHPNFFDGTTIECSRILVRCAIYDSTDDQAAAREKLEKIRKDILARNVTFAAAAGSFSDCPSKAKNGQLGRIEFGGPFKEMMFKIVAFMTEEGGISPVFRTDDGWELVLVTKIERGDGKPKMWTDPLSGKGVPTETLAKQAIVAMINNQLLRSTLDICPVTNHMNDGNGKKQAPNPKNQTNG